MKEQRITSKLRGKIQKDSDAKVYKLTKEEAIDFVKEHFIDPCTSIEQLDGLKLVPSFKLFKAGECTLNNWKYQHYINPNSMTDYYNVYFFDEKNCYYYGIFWLTGGSFNSKIKKLVEAKKEELKKD